jgi:AcrR family transcriptional regulator
MDSVMAAVAGQGTSTGKQRVLEAAHHLFAEGSYGGIGVAQIIERAGVQAPTLYHHFGDKEGLFVAWAEAAFGKVEDAVARVAQRNASTEDGLCAYAAAMLATLNFDIMQVLRDAPRLNKSENRDRVLSAYMSAVYEPLATVLVQATATQELRPEPIGQLTDVFLGGLLALRNSHVPVEAIAEKAAWWCGAFVRAFAAR